MELLSWHHSEDKLICSRVSWREAKASSVWGTWIRESLHQTSQHVTAGSRFELKTLEQCRERFPLGLMKPRASPGMSSCRNLITMTKAVTQTLRAPSGPVAFKAEIAQMLPPEPRDTSKTISNSLGQNQYNSHSRDQRLSSDTLTTYPWFYIHTPNKQQTNINTRLILFHWYPGAVLTCFSWLSHNLFLSKPVKLSCT